MIELEPGSPGDELDISLEVCELDHATFFEALSYVWGSSDGSRVVRCDQTGPLTVTDNLYAALCNLRHETKVRRLWVDAICINQSDTWERSSQVTLMQDIYSRASQVLVWLPYDLGREDYSMTSEESRTKDVFALMREVARLDTTQYSWLPPNVYKTEGVSTCAGIPIEASLLSAVLAFFRHDWFHRTWVLQEVALARSAVLLCPYDSISWSTFAIFCERFLTPEIAAVGIRGGPHLIKAVQIVRRELRTATPPDLWKLLLLRRDSSATEAVDHVYALLGLTSDHWRKLVNVNYNLTYRQLFTSLARTLIAEKNSLDMLSAVRNPASARHHPRVPSWVPDWSQRWESKLILYNLSQRDWWDLGYASKFTAGLCLGRGHLQDAAEEKSVNEQDILSLPGYHFANVTVVSSIIYFSHPSYFARKIRQWFAMIEPMAGLAYPGEELMSYLEAFSATLVADTSALGGEASTTLRRALILILEASEGTDSIYNTEPIKEYLQCALDIVPGRCFFVLDNGYIGLGPGNMAVEDEVCILAGGSVPYVVSVPEGERGHRTFIGECYVHGIMHGEAVRDRGGSSLTHASLKAEDPLTIYAFK